MKWLRSWSNDNKICTHYVNIIYSLDNDSLMDIRVSLISKQKSRASVHGLGLSFFFLTKPQIKFNLLVIWQGYATINNSPKESRHQEGNHSKNIIRNLRQHEYYNWSHTVSTSLSSNFVIEWIISQKQNNVAKTNEHRRNKWTLQKQLASLKRNKILMYTYCELWQ